MARFNYGGGTAEDPNAMVARGGAANIQDALAAQRQMLGRRGPRPMIGGGPNQVGGAMGPPGGGPPKPADAAGGGGGQFGGPPSVVPGAVPNKPAGAGAPQVSPAVMPDINKGGGVMPGRPQRPPSRGGIVARPPMTLPPAINPGGGGGSAYPMEPVQGGGYLARPPQPGGMGATIGPDGVVTVGAGLGGGVGQQANSSMQFPGAGGPVGSVDVGPAQFGSTMDMPQTATSTMDFGGGQAASGNSINAGLPPPPQEQAMQAQQALMGRGGQQQGMGGGQYGGAPPPEVLARRQALAQRMRGLSGLPGGQPGAGPLAAAVSGGTPWNYGPL